MKTTCETVVTQVITSRVTTYCENAKALILRKATIEIPLIEAVCRTWGVEQGKCLAVINCYEPQQQAAIVAAACWNGYTSSLAAAQCRQTQIAAAALPIPTLSVQELPGRHILAPALPTAFFFLARVQVPQAADRQTTCNSEPPPATLTGAVSTAVATGALHLPSSGAACSSAPRIFEPSRACNIRPSASTETLCRPKSSWRRSRPEGTTPRRLRAVTSSEIDRCLLAAVTAPTAPDDPSIRGSDSTRPHAARWSPRPRRH
ncbi:hypothetical protein V8E36_009489 [Tilletia maclaganii]